MNAGDWIAGRWSMAEIKYVEKHSPDFGFFVVYMTALHVERT
jgi:hypothetical protein